MSFQTALSGLNAASADLRITGNNIANASTVGFKSSRAEFADVYASSLLGSGANQIGSGVKLANVAQQFDQGTISFTNNSLDLAIDGNGFFVLSDNGARAYTRSGGFGVDNEGFVVANNGSRVQGFTANAAGTLSGLLGDLQINTSNLPPLQTTLVEASVNLNARDGVLSEIGSRIDTTGSVIGVAQAGLSAPTPSVLETSGPPAPFDFSVNTASGITAGSVITPFDFSINQPSAVSGGGTVAGFDFSLNTPSSLSGAGAPVNFNFADKPSAVSGTAAVTSFDYSGANSATFDVTIAGSASDGTATVTLNSNLTNVTDLINAINPQLAAVGVVAQSNPLDATQVEFVATVPGQASTITVDNYTASGAATVADVTASLSGIADGSVSTRSSFDVTVTGGTNNGTATITLTDNITNMPTLLTDIQDQLAASGLSVDVRSDPINTGRLQFFSTDDGVASAITVDNFQTTDSGVATTDLVNLLRLADGATNSAPGAGAIGATGSLTAATFDLSIAGGSGPGGNASTTITLDQNFLDNDIAGVAAAINAQLAALPLPGVDVIAREDPTNPGRLQFAATVEGETSTVTVDNFQVSGIAGDVQTTAANITGVLGGVADGASDSSGNDTSATFQVTLAGSSVPSENQTVSVTLDSNVNTLQDLINDIRDDLAGTGIGLDVREDPNSFGRLQFFALNNGEASAIVLDPNANLTLGIGVNQSDVEAAIGGISLGQGGAPGASNTDPDPFGTSTAQGEVGNITSASFDVTLAGSSANNGTATIQLNRDIQDVNDLILDVRDDLLASGIGVDVQEDPDNPGRLQFFTTIAGESSSMTISNLDTSNGGVSQNDLVNALNLATGVTVPGVAAVDNGYAPQSVDVITDDAILGTEVQTVLIPQGASAAEIAAQFAGSDVPGVSAEAVTVARLPTSGFNNTSGTVTMTVNGRDVTGATLQDLVTSINEADGLGTVSAVLDVNGDLVATDQQGNDLTFAITGGLPSDSVEVIGQQGGPVTLSTGGDSAASIGGTISFELDEGVTLANAVPTATNLFGVLNEAAFTPFEQNTFDPNNQETYNSATSVTIFDSLGNAHALSLYFVKERSDPNSALDQNRWTLHALVDGRDIGDPDPNAVPPANTQPTRASFALQFNQDGTLNPAGTDTMFLSNWVPVDENGQPNGAMGPLNVLNGGSLPLPSPPMSSNFEDPVEQLDPVRQ